jgi:Circularly permutated YpsA SLOG family
VSGGQTGVDRAALDVAISTGIPCGGWCPKGRRAEDGALASRYRMYETPSAGYAQRTEWNVRDSDGTLILSRGPLEGGSLLTAEVAERYRRPLLVADPTLVEPAGVRSWIDTERIRILNVAGPRASRDPDAYDVAERLLRAVLRPPV